MTHSRFAAKCLRAACLAIPVAIVCSCSSNSVDPPDTLDNPVPGADTLVMSARIDGEQWIGRDSLQADYNPQTGELVVHYATRDGVITRQIGVVLYDLRSTGEVLIEDSTDGDAKFVIREDKATSVYAGLGTQPAPRVRITRMDSEMISGSFSFDAVAISGPQIGDTVEIASGRFNLRRTY